MYRKWRQWYCQYLALLIRMRPFPWRCYFVYFQSQSGTLPWRCLNQAIGAGSGLQFFGYRGKGAGRTLACFSPYGFSMQNLSTFWFPHNGQFRVRESSDHRVAGQLLVTLFHSFEENVFHMSLEMEEIGNPSVSLLSLIDQSDMLNSPPPSPPL